MKRIFKSEYKGDLRIGEMSFKCAVLDNGKRIIHETSISQYLGSLGGKNYRLREKSSNNNIPLFASSKALTPFINDIFDEDDLIPISYTTDGSKNISKGYMADILPKVCEVWLKAREHKKLQTSQLPKAQKAEMLMRSLAKVGITALVDEATGYQNIRIKDALQVILDKYLRKEFAIWAKKFPDEFYKHIFRLKNWEYTHNIKKPGVVGTYTNDLVYERLAPEILTELQKLNPKTEKGYRKQRHHQWLTEDVGHSKLKEHLYGLLGLMRVCEDGKWEQFYNMVETAYPKKTGQMKIIFQEYSNKSRETLHH